MRVNIILTVLFSAWLQAGAQTAVTPPFPRLATIYSKTGAGVSQRTDEGKRVIAKFDLYIPTMNMWGGPCGNDSSCRGHAGMTIGQYLKFLNPHQMDLIYVHSAFFPRWSAPRDGRGYIVGDTSYYFDLRWLLTYAGTIMHGDVDPLIRNIPVAELSPFAIGDFVLIGGIGRQNTELVKVTSKSATDGQGELTVERAQMDQEGKFPAVAHVRGDYVRPVAYAWKQGFLACNVSAACPRSDINPGLGMGQTYNQFLASFWTAKITRDSVYSNLDGVFLDNYVDLPSQLLHTASAVDYTNSNKATPSPENKICWQKGMADQAREMRLRLPGKLIVANTGGSADNSGSWLNGGMIEGVNQDGRNRFVGDADANPMGYYNSWMNKGAIPRVFIYNASDAISGSLEDARTDYRAMRFLLTLTLLNDGYFDYDEFLVKNPTSGLNSGGHQSAWWYDEYDNAGRGQGYLGYPSSEALQLRQGVWRRDFQHGITLCNTSDHEQKISLEKPYKKIAGTQDPTVNDGSTVTTVTLRPKDGIILLSR